MRRYVWPVGAPVAPVLRVRCPVERNVRYVRGRVESYLSAVLTQPWFARRSAAVPFGCSSQRFTHRRGRRVAGCGPLARSMALWMVGKCGARAPLAKKGSAVRASKRPATGFGCGTFSGGLRGSHAFEFCSGRVGAVEGGQGSRAPASRPISLLAAADVRFFFSHGWCRRGWCALGCYGVWLDWRSYAEDLARVHGGDRRRVHGCQLRVYPFHSSMKSFWNAVFALRSAAHFAALSQWLCSGTPTMKPWVRP